MALFPLSKPGLVTWFSAALAAAAAAYTPHLTSAIVPLG